MENRLPKWLYLVPEPAHASATRCTCLPLPLPLLQCTVPMRLLGGATFVEALACLGSYVWVQ